MDKKIIFLFGSPRSGTTMLGQIFDKNNSIKYIGENRWLYYYVHFGFLNSNFFKEFYMRSFSNFISQFSEPYIVDKTPSNCLISSQLISVFNVEKAIYIHRELNQVFPSSLAEWQGKINDRGSLDSYDERKKFFYIRFFNKIKNKGFIKYRLNNPFWWPTLIIDIFWGISYILRSLLKIPFLWGPINSDILKHFLTNSYKDTVKYQWYICNKMCLLSFIEKKANIFKIDYKNLCDNPNEIISSMFNFLNLENVPNNIKKLDRNYKIVDNKLQKKIDELYDSI